MDPLIAERNTLQIRPATTSASESREVQECVHTAMAQVRDRSIEIFGPVVDLRTRYSAINQQ
ncbi:hypothetical protein BDZ97DRAFT_1787332 [Flammula alnicola]|nr:hypothetical protein BDZ97DRAFT_1787332 [Flammula alnicola]